MDKLKPDFEQRRTHHLFRLPLLFLFEFVPGKTFYDMDREDFDPTNPWVSKAFFNIGILVHVVNINLVLKKEGSYLLTC